MVGWSFLLLNKTPLPCDPNKTPMLSKKSEQVGSNQQIAIEAMSSRPISRWPHGRRTKDWAARLLPTSIATRSACACWSS